MDSANSGSLQSSSGGDEEYDSRAADSVSAFMSGGGGGGGGGSVSHQAPPFFDPLSGYLQLQQNPSLLNPNLSWPRTAAPPLRSDQNPIGNDVVHSMFPASNSYMPCFQPSTTGMGADGGGGGAATQLNQGQAAAAARNPKKRSRASRRAPTTVLTTDTTNFRAMVQEFTGIPAPPFNSSSFPRSRLDFFSSRSAATDAAQPPPYLRRPFAQKVQPPHPFLSPSSSSSLLSSAALDAISASTAPSAAAAAAASTSTPSMNYQMQIAQNQNLFNLQNQNLLTSLLQSNPKFPFSTAAITTSHDNQYTHQTLAALPNLIPSDHNADATNAANWSPGGGGESRPSLNGGAFDYAKTSFSAASSTPENNNNNGNNGGGGGGGGVRGEGMMESWICSSE